MMVTGSSGVSVVGGFDLGGCFYGSGVCVAPAETGH